MWMDPGSMLRALSQGVSTMKPGGILSGSGPGPGVPSWLAAMKTEEYRGIVKPAPCNPWSHDREGTRVTSPELRPAPEAAACGRPRCPDRCLMQCAHQTTARGYTPPRSAPVAIMQGTAFHPHLHPCRVTGPETLHRSMIERYRSGEFLREPDIPYRRVATRCRRVEQSTHGYRFELHPLVMGHDGFHDRP